MLKNLRKWLYKCYKSMDDNACVATISFFAFNEIKPWLSKAQRPCVYRSSRIVQEAPKPLDCSDIKNLKVAAVSDEMTYRNFREECHWITLTPHDWLEKMEQERPDIFFCESAWSGPEKDGACWKGKIYRNKNVKYNNRRVLFQILDYCHRKGIPTVFWNKEDPTFFGNRKNDFVDTACAFDLVLTTAGECVEEYRKLGCQNVQVWRFGFSPRLFSGCADDVRENKAVFAGSWYQDLPERCKDMEEMFDMVLEKGIALEIYDRYSESTNPHHQYPEKYRDYIKKAVPFQELGEITRRAEYAVNVNTVKDSTTMFARRVFELMACGNIMISNASAGMKELFPDTVWYLGENYDINKNKENRNRNMETVMRDHTNQKRLEELLSFLEQV